MPDRIGRVVALLGASVVLACSGGQKATSGGPRSDLHCTPQADFDDAAIGAAPDGARDDW